MGVRDSIKAITMLSVQSSTLNGSTYTKIGTLGQSCFLLKLINNSPNAVFISFDGTHDHDFLEPSNNNGSISQVNAQTNSQPNGYLASFPANTTVYAKSTAGTGTVMVAGYYQPSF